MESTSELEQEFKEYLKQYCFEKNELLQVLFIERQFKFAEIAFQDSYTKQPIRQLPVFSGVCLDKNTASICLFDSSTIFNVLFPTPALKSDFSSLIPQQTAKCPSCGEEIQFSLLVCDSLLMDFFNCLKNNLTSNDISKTQPPILRLERIRNKSAVKYQGIFDRTNDGKVIEFSGELNVEKKQINMSIEQYNRVQQDLEAEINDKTKTEEEIRIKKSIKEMISLEQNRAKDIATDTNTASTSQKASSIISEPIEQPFRILKISSNLEGDNLKIKENLSVYVFKGEYLYLTEPKSMFSRNFQVIQLFRKKNDVFESVDMDRDEEMKGFKSILLFNTVILVVTRVKVFSLQLINFQEVKSNEGIVTGFRGCFDEIFSFDSLPILSQNVPQIGFLQDNLYLLEYREDSETICFRVIEDILVYPQERVLPQPSIYLEISETSQREKVLLLCDDHTNSIGIITPDQYFEFNITKDQWEKEVDFDLSNFYTISDSGEEEIQTISTIFEDTSSVIPICVSNHKFWVFSAKKQFLYEIDLKNLTELQEIESSLNTNIISQNVIIKNESIIYAIQIQNERQQFNEKDCEAENQSEEVRIENEFYETLRNQLMQFTFGSVDNKKQKYCENLSIYSSSVFI